MEERFIKNIPAITEEEQARLRAATVLVAGAGGLGGYVIEMLARVGVDRIIVSDGDTFAESNLNRQLYCTEDNIGSSKAFSAQERLKAINSEVRTASLGPIETFDWAGYDIDLVIDCLDNIPSRLWLEDKCEQMNIPFVHGAIAGWRAQAAFCRPGRGMLHDLYREVKSEAAPCLSFTPAYCASVQVCEAVQYLTGRMPELDGKLMLADLEHFDIDIIEF